MIRPTTIPTKNNILTVIAANLIRWYTDFQREEKDNTANPFQVMETLTSSRSRDFKEVPREAGRNGQVNGFDTDHGTNKQLINVVAHDLKNPMIGIRGIAELLLDDEDRTLTNDQKAMIDRIVSGSNSALHLIEE